MRIIDIHTHLIPDSRVDDRDRPFVKGMTGGADVIKRRARRAGITDSVVLSLGRRSTEDPEVRELLEDSHFYAMAGFNPTDEDQVGIAANQLRHKKVVGIKCHPPRDGYRFSDHAETIFEFARRQRIPVITHAQVHAQSCDPFDCVESANEYPDVNLILAHLGISTAHLTSDLHIAAIQRSRHGNVYLDCSFINSIYHGLVEKAVRLLGSERVVFGTDSPIHHPSAFVEVIRSGDFSSAEKENILHKNAEGLLGI